jgi:hypothetical protein
MSSTAVQAEVAGKARNFTYNMNAAGDMPYNQNTLALVFQFMQVPHKALLTMTTNRVLTPKQKGKLLAFNSVMYTLPPAALISWFGSDGADILPENQEARTAVLQGLEGYMFNTLIKQATGMNSSIDIHGIAPLDPHGLYEFMHNIFTGEFGAVLASTPSGQLFFGNNPRITNFVKSTARYTNLIDDYENPTEFSKVAKDASMMFSGFSNAFKAAYVIEYGRKYGTLGGTTDSTVETPNAIALAFGFQSMEDAINRHLSDTTYKASTSLEEDVTLWHKQLKAHLLSSGEMPTTEYITKVNSEAFRVWGNDNVLAKQHLERLMRKDMANGDNRLMDNILKQHEIWGSDGVKDMYNTIPMDEAVRQRGLDTIDLIDSLKVE